MTSSWCKTCQLEHSSGHCPVAASTVEQIEGYQQHLERKFWEQAYCAFVQAGQEFEADCPSAFAECALDEWRKRWGKK